MEHQLQNVAEPKQILQEKAENFPSVSNKVDIVARLLEADSQSKEALVHF